jgi:hypothetical protein
MRRSPKIDRRHRFQDWKMITFSWMQVLLVVEFPIYYVSFEFGPIRWFLEIVDITSWFRRRRIQLPICPSCMYNNHPSINIQERDTYREWIYYTYYCDLYKYHLVEIYSVKGCFDFMPLQDPKSANFNVSSESRRFSGFISRWKIPFLCIWSMDFRSWYI